MAANTVGVNSTFEQQRLVINQISEDLDSLIQNPIFLNNVGIGTTNASSKLTVDGDGNFTGAVTATQGFISVGNTTPIQISLIGNELIFTAVGIGSTTFTLA